MFTTKYYLMKIIYIININNSIFLKIDILEERLLKANFSLIFFF